MQSLLASC